MTRSLHMGLTPHHDLHGKLRCNPGTAASAPSAIVVHVDLDAKPRGFLENKLKQFPPLGAQEAGGSFRDALVDLHDQDSADADAVHRLEIGGDAFARNIAVRPEPINPWPGRVRRIGEPLAQPVIIRQRQAGDDSEEYQWNEKPLQHNATSFRNRAVWIRLTEIILHIAEVTNPGAAAAFGHLEKRLAVATLVVYAGVYIMEFGSAHRSEEHT